MPPVAAPGGLAIADYDRDDDLLAAVEADGRGRLRVYAGGDPLVVLGRGSQPERELQLEACIADGVPLCRRRGGGCAVVIDPGNVVVALALAASGFGQTQRYLAGASRWLIDGLHRLGIAGVVREGACDLAQGGRKVGGACLYRRRGLVFYSTTLLVAPRVELMTRYLRHPPREPPYRAGRAHADFVNGLGRPGLTVATLVADLQRVLAVPASADLLARA